MEGIKDKVAIVGMGCTRFGERWDMGVEDLLVEAAYEAFQDAGIEPKDVQAAWLGTVFSGVSALTLSPVGLQYIPVTRVENMCATGSEALRGASYAVAAGICDIALAIGVEKLKDSGATGLKGRQLSVTIPTEARGSAQALVRRHRLPIWEPGIFITTISARRKANDSSPRSLSRIITMAVSTRRPTFTIFLRSNK